MVNNISNMLNKDYGNEELFSEISDYALDKEIEEGYDKCIGYIRGRI